MKLKELRSKINQKYVVSKVKTEGGDVEIRFPLLTIGDWAAVKEKTGVDVWNLLLTTSADSDPTKLESMSVKEGESEQRRLSINLLKTLDYSTHKEIVYRSLLHVDPDATDEDVDHIVTYGISGSEFMRVINFLVYNIDEAPAGKEGAVKKETAASAETIKTTDTPTA